MSSVLVLFVVCCIAQGRVQEDGRPLPDRDAFLQEVMKRLRSDGALQSGYAFIEREVRERFDSDGRRIERTEKIFEVYPMPDHSDPYRRLVVSNSIPTPARELEEGDRRYREKVTRSTRERQNESPADRAERERQEAKARTEEAQMVRELFRVFDMQLIGREVVHGRPAIAVRFTPRPGVQPTIRDLNLITKLRGRGLVDEVDHELVRVNVEVTDTIRIGLGLLARIDEGTTVTAERQKANDEFWLPSRLVVHALTHIAVFKRNDTTVTREYRDYCRSTPGSLRPLGLGTEPRRPLQPTNCMRLPSGESVGTNLGTPRGSGE